MEDERPSRNYYDGLYHELLEKLGQMIPIPEPNQQEGIRLQQYMMNAEVDFRLMRDLYKVVTDHVNQFGKHKREEAERSKFRALIDLDREEKGDGEEVLRLAYVHLYHRYETFYSGLFALIDAAKGITRKSEGCVALMERYYDIDLNKAVILSEALSDTYFICNCVKHVGGIPAKFKEPIPLPKRLTDTDLNKPMILSREDLFKDIIMIGEGHIPIFFLGLMKIHDRARIDRQLHAPGFHSLDMVSQNIIRRLAEDTVAQCDAIWDDMIKFLPKRRRRR